MTTNRALRGAAAAIIVALALAGCKSERERLTEYLESGEAYAASGDYARAIIQFRNALKIDPDHAQSRAAVGNVLLEQGALGEARQEFVMLAERFPAELEFRSRLGEIALVSSDWTMLARQAKAAEAIDAEALDSRALVLADRYRNAVREREAGTQAEVSASARALLDDDPDQPVLLRIVLDHLTRGDAPADALPVLDAALDADPHSPDLQLLRIRLLADEDRMDVAEARLLELAALYPGEPQIAGLLVARHLSRGRLDAAEGVLRALADGAPAGEPAMRMLLIRFLQRWRGPAAAKAELARQIDLAGESPSALLFAGMDRAIRFDEGDRDGAVESLREILSNLSAQTREAASLRVLLATLHDKLGDRAAARAEIETVLGEDPYDPQALKLRATWALDENTPKSAIVDLRAAMSQQPRDTEMMTLLAAAHAMDGNRSLAMEQLSTAAQVSGHAARESERYARALISDGREKVALRVLEVAHSAAPGDVALARFLADRQLDAEDWPAAARTIAGLRGIDSAEAQAAMAPLRSALLLGQSRKGEALAEAEAMLRTGGGRQEAFAQMIDGFHRRGDLAGARVQIDAALARHPGDAALRLIAAEQRLAEGDLGGGEAALRAIIAEGAPDDAASLRLFHLLAGAGRREEAEAALAEGLSLYPASRPLRLIEANRREVTGDLAGAIALLEALHGEDRADLVVANNLASLLTAATDDQAVLARAARIVAPLRGTANPAVSDTIGWIAYRRGDPEGALPLMERAARGLPGDAAVQARLGQVHAALGQDEAARAAFAAVLNLAPEDHPLAEEAGRRIAALGG